MVGKILAQYQISEKLGEGGMGVVWKARDTHLDRFVALKTLSAERLADPERKRRFVQEAKAASALNHPNIIHIYDIAEADGVQFIAMEYVAGKTLDHLISRKGLRLNETLKYAVQIADALAKAHAAGIIHRDLKPSNIMVTENGLVKVLDFGLAKLAETATGEFGETATVRAAEGPNTEEGTIVGTTAYMSPEQAEGKKVDARSDIFSFGSVLYEIVTGRRAFHGDSRLSTLSAILKDDPKPVSSIMPDVPRDMEKIISRCLRKDPDRRFQHMDDARVALEELKEESESGKLEGVAAPGVASRRNPWLRWAPITTTFLLLALLAVGYWFLRPASHAMPRIVPLTGYVGFQCCATLSPDGNLAAFVWDGPKHDKPGIYVKVIGTENILRITDETGNSPAWSPDGRYIAFEKYPPQGKPGVFLVPPIGGPDRKVTELNSGGSLSWFPDGQWLAVADQDSLWRLSINTGEKRKLTTPPPEHSDFSPAVSPDGRTLAFSRISGYGLGEIFLLPLSADLIPKGQPRQLTFRRQSSTAPAWTPDGREVIFSSGSFSGESELWRMPASGGAQPQRLFASAQGSEPAISRRGDRLAFTRSLTRRSIWNVEVSGSNRIANKPVNLISSVYNEEAQQYSPDGKKIAFTSMRSGPWEVWVSASDGSNPQQLTSLGAAGSPRWSPDGQRIVFDSNVEGQFEIYMIDAAGGTPRRMTNHPADDAVASWSRDGRWLYFVSNRTKDWQIWRMPASGGEATQVTKHGGRIAVESFDGKSLYVAKDVWETSIWRVPLDGGEEQKIQESVLGQAFALARKGIYFVSPHSDGSSVIQFHSFATGKVTPITTIHQPLGWGLSVSPDERNLLYIQFDQAGTNLMLVENFR